MMLLGPPLRIPSADAMTEFGRQFSAVLRPKDTILLEGEIGAGKTHFARAVLQSLMDPVEDVPSPTFTLIQTYHLSIGTVWHADLYRLTDSYEISELGLEDAFDTDICLVEWPDRLGVLAPQSALLIEFHAEEDDSRVLTFKAASDAWKTRLEDLR